MKKFNQQKSVWDRELRAFIKSQWRIGEEFALQELYSECEGFFEQLHPDNKNVRAKLRQTLSIFVTNGLA